MDAVKHDSGRGRPDESDGLDHDRPVALLIAGTGVTFWQASVHVSDLDRIV